MANSGRANGGGRLVKIGGAVSAVAIAAIAAALGLDLTPASNDAAPESTATSTKSSTSRKANPANAKDGVCPVAELPSQAEMVIEGIRAGDISGPENGKHFGNFEGILPKQRSSYYREYTVQKPGMDHRGPWRIVVGGGSKTDPDVWYFTFDHYETFCNIPDAEK